MGRNTSYELLLGIAFIEKSTGEQKRSPFLFTIIQIFIISIQYNRYSYAVKMHTEIIHTFETELVHVE